MQIVKCKSCGAQLDITKAVGGVAECEYCHSKHTLAKSSDINAVNFLAMGEHGLDNGKFDEAYSAYGKAASIDGSEPEAYFGMALAANKIRYIKDVKNNRLQPVCYDATDKSFVADNNYTTALSLASDEQKAEYIRRAGEIDYIRNEFYKLKQAGREYDCFICVKVTDDATGRKTTDSERANDIYYHLKDKGYKPFYSERELQNEAGADYEARILYALFSSPCMLIVCSDESLLQTPWVKNEYSRFITLINDEKKEADSIAICFFDAPIERLPNRRGRLQGVCLKNPDAYGKIVEFVDNCSPTAKLRKAQAEEKRKAEEAELKRRLEEQTELQAKQLEEFKRRQEQAQKELQDKLAALQTGGGSQSQSVSVGASTNIQALLARVNQFLDSGDYNSVETYCNRILDIDPTNGEAWLGLFMASINAYSPDVVLKRLSEMRFSSTAQVSRLMSDAAFVNAKKYAVKYKPLLDEVQALYDRSYSEKCKEDEIKRRDDEFLKHCVVRDGCLEKFDKDCGITDVVIPNSITSIGDKAFEGCSLTSIYIPSSVTSIGKNALGACYRLKHIEVAADNRYFQVIDGCLIEASKKIMIKVCNNSAIRIPDGIYSIAYNAFSCCFDLTSIEIPNSVKYIGDEAFSICQNLTSVVMPNSVESIGNLAFYGCKKLTNIKMPNYMEYIWDYAFCDCECLTSIEIPDGVTTIRSGTFNGCKSLESIVIPNGVTKIEDNAFENCSSLKSIVIPSSMILIGFGVFRGCDSLSAVTISKRYKKRLIELFRDKKAIKRIKFTFTK